MTTMSLSTITSVALEDEHKCGPRGRIRATTKLVHDQRDHEDEHERRLKDKPERRIEH